jgi:flagellar biosynthesis protein FliR
VLLEVFAHNLYQIPPGQLVLSGPALKALVRLSGEIFRVGLQASAPAVAALFAANVILGIFARSVPQMNMLILGFPLKILVGFTVLALSLPHWGRVVLRSLSEAFETLQTLPLLLR